MDADGGAAGGVVEVAVAGLVAQPPIGGIDRERDELEQMPQAELHQLAGLLEAKGLSKPTALQAARELTAADALSAHLDIELGLDAEDIPSPIGAAVSSGLAFTLGALLPALAILLPPERAPFLVVAFLSGTMRPTEEVNPIHAEIGALAAGLA